MPGQWKRTIELIEDAAAIDPPTAFGAACAEFGVSLERGEVSQLARYVGLLLANNERVNLTGVKDPDELWMRHVFDALTPIAVLGDLPGGASIADVGSGGGLPAVVLATAMPNVDVVMIESTGKKAAFLKMVVQRLGLGNAAVACARAEELGRDAAHRERYDAVTARAVGPLRVIVELCTPLVRVGGHAVLIKGERAEQELVDAKKSLHMLHATHETTVDTPTGRLVVLSKGRATPRMYPRRPGEPKRAPL